MDWRILFASRSVNGRAFVRLSNSKARAPEANPVKLVFADPPEVDGTGCRGRCRCTVPVESFGVASKYLNKGVHKWNPKHPGSLLILMTQDRRLSPCNYHPVNVTWQIPAPSGAVLLLSKSSWPACRLTNAKYSRPH
jgi:hypothetical protein